MDSRGISARPVQALDQAVANRIAAAREHDRDDRRRRERCARRLRAARCGDHAHPPADEIGGERRQPIVLPFGPAILDWQVLAFDVTGLAQAAAERSHEGDLHLGGPGAEIADGLHCWLL